MSALARQGHRAAAPDSLPRAGADSTLALLREGYRFVSNRCERLGRDAFRTRLMLREVACMRGPDAAAAFYHPGRFTRQGAMPRSALTLLQDRGSVQTLDGTAHRHRKAAFMAMMDEAALARAGRLFGEEWQIAADGWSGRAIVLHEAAADILARTALRWCGIDPQAEDVAARRRELVAMIAGAGSIGPTHLRAQALRQRAERWARRLIGDIRAGRRAADPALPAARLAGHTDTEGARLPETVAAVELLNLLRPIVAVGRYIVFAAHALHVHGGPGGAAGAADRRAFVQEVRRFYPFFPMVGGRALEPFVWRGHRFSAGAWVLLDLYGTNRHPQAWPEPDAFRPERFADWRGDAFAMVPQGGGGFEGGHRCPGEWLTIALTGEAVRLLTQEMRYGVPAQDLTIALDRFPTGPASGFVIAVE